MQIFLAQYFFTVNKNLFSCTNFQTPSNNLIIWRRKKERQFNFNPKQDIDQADLARLNQKYDPSKIRIELALLSGPEQLAQIKSEILQKRQTLHPEVSNAAKAFAQAKADLSLL